MPSENDSTGLETVEKNKIACTREKIRGGGGVGLELGGMESTSFKMNKWPQTHNLYAM